MNSFHGHAVKKYVRANVCKSSGQMRRRVFLNPLLLYVRHHVDAAATWAGRDTCIQAHTRTCARTHARTHAQRSTLKLRVIVQNVRMHDLRAVQKASNSAFAPTLPTNVPHNMGAQGASQHQAAPPTASQLPHAPQQQAVPAAAAAGGVGHQPSAAPAHQQAPGDHVAASDSRSVAGSGGQDDVMIEAPNMGDEWLRTGNEYIGQMLLRSRLGENGVQIGVVKGRVVGWLPKEVSAKACLCLRTCSRVCVSEYVRMYYAFKQAIRCTCMHPYAASALHVCANAHKPIRARVIRLRAELTQDACRYRTL
jgi:hypothetical protein